MDIFISYSGSARDAERELRKLFEQLWSVETLYSNVTKAGGGGWSRMLPGIVCNLGPDASEDIFPALFIGLLNDQFLISCELERGSAITSNMAITRLLGTDNLFHRSGGIENRKRHDRMNFFARIVDASAAVRPLFDSPARPASFGWEHTEVSEHRRNAALTPILELARSRQETINERLPDLLSLLWGSVEGGASASICRKLTREYNCRFAWSSIQHSRMPQFASSADLAIGSRRLPAMPEEEGIGFHMRALRSFWEKSDTLMRPFNFTHLRYSSLVEQRSNSGWPSWLQFLIFVSNAGRRANAKLRTYEMPRLLPLRARLRRKKGSTSGNGADRSGATDAGSLKTLAELFRGCDKPRPVGCTLRRHRMPRSRRKEILLKIERALYVPNADTILSLYRGKPCFVPVAARKPRKES